LPGTSFREAGARQPAPGDWHGGLESAEQIPLANAAFDLVIPEEDVLILIDSRN